MIYEVFLRDHVKPEIRAQINGVHYIVELHNILDFDFCYNQN